MTTEIGFVHCFRQSAPNAFSVRGKKQRKNKMDINSFKEIARLLPPEVAPLLIGDHGIGKSQAVYQLAEELKLPVRERRLSQMTEGDMIGLPKMEGESTKFCPPDWYMDACNKPCVLFLDEINRATPEIMQAAFQIVLDKELNGYKLHPETRVFAAINQSVNYQVNEMDPALMDRFFIIHLSPNHESWIAWAQASGEIPESMIDFIRQNPRHLEHTDKNYDAKEIYPSRRSWHRSARSLKYANLVDKFETLEFYQIVMGFVGPAAASSYVDFLKNYDKLISAEDILNAWTKTKKVLSTKKFTNERLNSIIEKLEDHAKANKWTEKQAKNVFEFSKEVPPELFLSLLQKISNSGTEDDDHNMITFYSFAQDYTLEVINQKFDEEGNEIKSEEQKEEPTK